MSGARLCGWLACDGFQTLLFLMILSAGQQKGHPSSWLRLPLRRVAAAGWLEFGSEYRCVRRAEIEEAPDDGKWQVVSAGVAYVSLINDGAQVALVCSSPTNQK